MTVTQPNQDTASYTRMTAEVYDAIYCRKDYKAEAEALKDFVLKYKESNGNELLDVACGTGLHLPYLTDAFAITGVDLSEQQLEAARERLPDLEFTQGDMRNFYLNKQFDVVTCLFSSIGYVHPYEELVKAIGNMNKHLKPGGVMLIEPWLQPGVFDPNRPPHTEVGELPERGIKVTRTGTNSLDGNISILTLHNLVESPDGKYEFTEEHKLAMYSKDELASAFKEAGLNMEWQDQGLSARGLCVAVKPTD
ncbi:MAG: class I SAM-dependent methyltransferase [Patescibacteria group bacterium]|jgi:ubiquinone/menaquinone biosynthesis C-methylase UbiE|nr:class I SAM-dependent methyltransferase [Patescibacteria group bacterium]